VKQKSIKMILIGISSFIIVMFCTILLFNYLKYEKEQFDIYSDYSQGVNVLNLSFIKDFDSQFQMVRNHQKFLKEAPITRGELLLDFASYNIIPSLKYYLKPLEHDELFQSFSNVLEILATVAIDGLESNEEIFSKRGQDDVYFIVEDEKQIYPVKKKMLTKKGFQMLYREYKGDNSLEEHFASLLLKNELVYKNYTRQELIKVLKNDYESFYLLYREVILSTLANDLQGFSKYLEKVENIDELDTEMVELFYRFSKVQRYYSGIKYYQWEYCLDFHYLWDQLKELGYPKLYQ